MMRLLHATLRGHKNAPIRARLSSFHRKVHIGFNVVHVFLCNMNLSYFRSCQTFHFKKSTCLYLLQLLQQVLSSVVSTLSSSADILIIFSDCFMQAFLVKFSTRRPDMVRTLPIATPSCPALNICRQST